MSIKDLEKVNARQVETLKRRQAREIRSLENAHDEYKADLKKAHKMEIVDLQDENLRQIATESEKKEKVLTQMRDHLQHTEHLTDKQLRELKVQAEKARSDVHGKLSVDRDRVQSEHELYLDDLNTRYQNEVRRAHHVGQNEVNRLNETKSQLYSEKEEFHQRRLNEQTNEFNVRYQNDGQKFRKIKDDQDKLFKKERLTTNTRQQQEIAKMTDGHNKAINVRDKEFRKGLKEQDHMFEQKYAQTMKVHNENFKRLNDLNDKVINKMKIDLKDKLVASVNRSDDPFYRFTELKPTLKTFPDRVEIQVEVPEHDKEDVALSFNQKEAIITFSRRYDDTKREEGVVNKLHKVESFTARLATPHVLDPKSVKSSYANGIMTYVVSKA